MSKRLEDFVKDNREDFDKFEPGPVVWHNIQQGLKKGQSKKGIMISMKALRWSAAAAILLLLGAGAWFFSQKKTTTQDIANTQNPKPANGQRSTNNDTTANGQRTTTNDNAQLASADDKDGYSEELYHYTRLVELKQDEIKKIQKDEPLLYQQFAGDITMLDSSFHILKKQLPVNPNREQILEAMIQNLQLQESVLNRQLNIIKQINQAKKTGYEKTYKTL